jgi:8-oxo-dGTP diphosphatase
MTADPTPAPAAPGPAPGNLNLADAVADAVEEYLEFQQIAVAGFQRGTIRHLVGSLVEPHLAEARDGRRRAEAEAARYRAALGRILIGIDLDAELILGKPLAGGEEHIRHAESIRGYVRQARQALAGGGEAPKPEPVAASVAVLIFRGDEVLLMRRKGGNADGLWAAPGGRVDAGETADDACRREVREETGVGLVNLRRLGAWQDYTGDRDGRAYLILWYAADAGPGPVEIREPDKCGGLEWFKVNALPSPLFPGTAEMVGRALAPAWSGGGAAGAEGTR